MIRKYSDYSKSEVETAIERLNASRKGNNVSTMIDGRTTAAVSVSDQYQFFDFKKFANQIMEVIDQQTEIEKYNLKITKGTQELNFLSNRFKINEDEHFIKWSLLNSNDKTKALQFNAGLHRLICSNGASVPVQGASSTVKAIHKGQSFLDKVDAMSAFIPTVPALIKKQTGVLTDLTTKEVSLKKFVQALIEDRAEETPDVTNSAILRTKSFINKMINSSTDRLDTQAVGLTNADIDLIKKPFDFLKAKEFDLQVNMYYAFQWYTEIFRNRDSAIIRTESDRFFRLTNQIQ